ncbi:hypothetical protein DFH94DRAFT_487643 [Russula ochroleuca]|uniref:Uncharacterized protein n=1 Tax=Russula ochroleuca TaxID=152965 RepID=A0A9P5MV95_9AGAM|nr:hypothetical protein DFH94DRAFT_487643 [Russula ochroleuca]
MSSSPSILDAPRPRPMHHMPTRLLSSLKRPFSRSKPETNTSVLPDRTREPGPGATPPSYEQIAMGLHLSRTPHFPAHLAHLYPPPPQQRLQRSVSSPASSTPHRAQKARPTSAHLYPYSNPPSHSHSPSTTPSRSPSRSYTRLPPPPARSALKKPHGKATATSSSGVTPDTASASTAASSNTPPTPTNSSARSGLLARFLGKERGTTPPLISIIAEVEPERKAVRFGGVEEEDE